MRAKRTNARASIMAERQQQQFQFGFCAFFGSAIHACNHATCLVNDSDDEVCNLRATRFAP